ncbi:hypothetical protein [Legionella maioricensis]|uniref:Uncharacterized protein n=1 Tax=Legionella maioricensis TaxID=2896528 RepID=A0A9X2ICX2_9GAMM|nr:hypothetical protein [Legionella maioricensis]MCL9685641.1 hypothetical protein [Legionella maioricensis]MCL9689050.1 hypothetical protein [Legionella maioricensis]
MKINGLNVELAINEEEILDLLENYGLNLDLAVAPENIAHYVEEQKGLLLEKHQHLTKRIQDLYEAKLSQLTKEQEQAETQVASDKSSLERLVQSANSRKEFCAKAQAALNTLKKIINKESPFSELQISKEELLAYFECQPTDRVAELINAIYDEEQAKNSWYGFNRKNLWSKFTTAPTEATEEEKELVGLIKQRLKQIEKELQFGKLGRKNIPDAPKNLAENNLYALTKANQTGQKQLKENETLVAQKKNSIIRVTKQQKAVLQELEARKSEQEQALLQAQVQVLLTGLATNLEKLTLECNEFKIKLTKAAQLNDAVRKIVSDLDTMTIDDLLPLISTNQPLFLVVNEFLNQESYPEDSVLQINQTTHNLLMAIKEELAGLQKIAEGIEPMPEELAEQQKQLMAQLKSLEGKYSDLNRDYSTIEHLLSHSKNLLDPFIQLARIKNQYVEFIKQISPGMTGLQRQELVNAIEIIRKEKGDLSKLVSSEEYTGLLTLEQIKTSLQDQEKILSGFLVAGRLGQIQSDYLSLIEKSKLIASQDPKEPNEVTEWVRGIEDLDKQSSFLEQASLSQNPADLHTIKTINNLKEELNASLYGQYENTTRIVTELYDAQLTEEQKKQTKTTDDISSTKITLETLIADAEARKIFLSKAQHALGELRTNLIKNKENNMLQTPREDVLAYFEDAPTGKASLLVNALYEMEQAKSSWYGINRKNVWNRLTSAYTSEETITAKKELIELIDARLLQIKNELDVNDITQVVERPSMPANLGERNLYALSAFHQHTQQSLAEKQIILEQQMEDYIKIAQQKSETLTLLESMKITHEAQMLLNKLEDDQEKIENQGLLFAQDIAALEQTYKELHDVTDTIDPLLKEKIAVQEKSLIELSKKINDSLAAHDQLFDEFETTFNEITNKPLSMMEQKEALFKKFNELRTRKIQLDESIRPQIVDAKKMISLLECLALAEQESEVQKEASQHTPLHLLSNVYFGTVTERANAAFGLGGLFGDYLQERANTFWFNDLISSIAAFALGCFGYKTGAQLRQEYLTNELQPALTTYQNEPTMEHYEDLINVIKDGKIQFPPRTAHNETEQNKSLLSKLRQLEAEVINSNLNELTDIDENRVQSSIEM